MSVTKTSDHVQIKKRAKIWNMGPPKTTDHIQIKIKMKNPSQKPQVSSKAPNQDYQDKDIAFTFKIKIESHNLDHKSIKDL